MAESETSTLQKHLESLAKSAFDEYKIISVDIPNRQAGYLKTYLWLASLMIAAELSIFNNILSRNFNGIEFLNRLPNPAFYLAAGIALACSAVVFVFGVDTLRGRRPHSIALGDLMKVIKIAERSAKDDDNSYFVKIIEAYNNAINHQATSCHQVGVKLRRMSRLILLSAGFAMLSVIAISVGSPITSADCSPPRQKEVITVPEENKEPSPQPPAPSPSSEDIRIEPTMIAVNSTHHDRPMIPDIQGRQGGKAK